MLRLLTPHKGRAKDGESRMSLEVARAVVPVEYVVGSRVARPQSLAAAGVVVGDVVRRRSAHGDHLAAGRGRQRRLPGLLLLPGRRRTQERIDRHAARGAGAVCVVPARAVVVGDRRHGPRSATARRSKARTFITIRRRARPVSHFSRGMCGSRFRWRCGIRAGVRWRCRCGRCCTSASRRWRRSPSAVVGRDSPPSCNWRRDWWSGSFRS